MSFVDEYSTESSSESENSGLDGEEESQMPGFCTASGGVMPVLLNRGLSSL